jgi:hypothetical protein
MENNEEISRLKDELFNPEINKQRKRYLEDLLNDSSKYNMPICNSFEKYCETYPWEAECRIYDL